MPKTTEYGVGGAVCLSLTAPAPRGLTLILQKNAESKSVRDQHAGVRVDTFLIRCSIGRVGTHQYHGGRSMVLIGTSVNERGWLHH